ncbi:MAG TPA: hypothetical protein VFI15_11050 [Candidatus Limnocylindrales bacterium]|nr:hypothetical protein [Candidatus Limnocylindrales bacterium]
MTDAIVASYRPGFASRVAAWVDTLPLRGLWVFPVLAAVLLLWGHVVLWVSGRLPVGAIDLTVATGVLYAPYGLAVFVIANRVALRSLNAFWPATGWPDSERPTWAYRFVTLPRGADVIALAIGTLLAIGTIASASDAFLGPRDTRWALVVALVPSLVLGYGAFPLIVVHTVRQLRLVMRIHREATAIDPFEREPVYAFSRLTVVTGLAYVIIGYYGLVVNGAFQSGNAASLAVLAGSFAVGIVTFIAPLWGIHERLVHEKELLLREVEARLGRLGAEMYRRVDGGEFDGTKAVGDSITGVNMLRDRIGRLPTWPWPPNVLRGFLSALLIPVVVYIASRLIGGNLGV